MQQAPKQNTAGSCGRRIPEIAFDIAEVAAQNEHHKPLHHIDLQRALPQKFQRAGIIFCLAADEHSQNSAVRNSAMSTCALELTGRISTQSSSAPAYKMAG